VSAFSFLDLTFHAHAHEVIIKTIEHIMLTQTMRRTKLASRTTKSYL